MPEPFDYSDSSTSSFDLVLERLLSNVHRSGFNYRHFGFITRTARVRLSAVEESISREDLSEETRNQLKEEKSNLESLIHCLTMEGIARTFKNLVQMIVY